MNRAVFSIFVCLALIACSAQEQKTGVEVLAETSAQTSSQTLVSKMLDYAPQMSGYLTRPDDKKAYPGVVMIHEWWGLNDNIKQTADQLAKEGYVVLAVDLYDSQVATTREEAMKYRAEADEQNTTQRLQAAAQYLKNEQATPKIASMGWCYGGGKSLDLALSGEPLDATVIYYGSLVTDESKLKSIQWPVLGIFGDKDTSIPVDTVNSFDQTLDNLNITNEIYIYPGVGHAFANPTGANYAPEETKDAWKKTTEFLAKNLQ